MNSNNPAGRQNVIEYSVDHQISSLANSTASLRLLETLLNSESVATHQPESGAMELRDKITGTDVRKLLGGRELPVGLRSALRQLAPDARIENAQTDCGAYRGGIIGETEKNLIQQITSHTAVLHRKDLLDMIPAVGENVRIACSNDNARVLSVKRRSKTQELGR